MGNIARNCGKWRFSDGARPVRGTGSNAIQAVWSELSFAFRSDVSEQEVIPSPTIQLTALFPENGVIGNYKSPHMGLAV